MCVIESEREKTSGFMSAGLVLKASCPVGGMGHATAYAMATANGLDMPEVMVAGAQLLRPGGLDEDRGEALSHQRRMPPRMTKVVAFLTWRRLALRENSRLEDPRDIRERLAMVGYLSGSGWSGDTTPSGVVVSRGHIRTRRLCPRAWAGAERNIAGRGSLRKDCLKAGGLRRGPAPFGGAGPKEGRGSEPKRAAARPLWGRRALAPPGRRRAWAGAGRDRAACRAVCHRRRQPGRPPGCCRSCRGPMPGARQKRPRRA